jgi:hypothetical protein
MSRLNWKGGICTALLIGIISISVCWAGERYFSIALQEGQSLLRASVLKGLEMVTEVYDPYASSNRTKLYPDDWKGWTADARAPGAAIGRLSDLTNQKIRLQEARIQVVDDRALSFAYESSNTAELRELRRLYQLESKINKTSTQLEQLAVLNNWARRQWIHGSNRAVNFYRFNALEILDQARKGGKFWCQVAAMSFVQITASLGYQARLLSLYDSNPDKEPVHAVVEVWLDELGKWVLFDTDFNLYYTNEFGIALNALELHDAVMTRRLAGIKVVKGDYRPERFDIEGASAQPLMLPYYRNFCVEMRNDWLSNTYFPGHPKRSDKNSLCWWNAQTAWFDRRRVARHSADLYWPLDNVDVRLASSVDREAPTSLLVYLKTITPNFERFEITQNNTSFFSNSSSLRWQLKAGKNNLMARSVNSAGIKGTASLIIVEWTDSRRTQVKRQFRQNRKQDTDA